MCFRPLYTLHSCGFLEKVGENQYRAVSEIRHARKYRIGYASQDQDSSFAREVAPAHPGRLGAAGAYSRHGGGD